MKIGLLSPYKNWLAGSLYTQTVIRALSQIPDHLRPEMHLFMPKSDDHLELYDSFHTNLESITYYDTLLEKSPWVKFKSMVYRMLKNRGKSISLLEHAAVSDIDVIFPTTKTLGNGCPCPWIGWIPDFQHKRLPDYFDAKQIAERDNVNQKLIHEAYHMVVSSEDAYRDLLNFYKASPDRISIYRFRTYAEPRWFEADPIHTANHFGLPEKFLMFPSQFWKHKNHELLLESLGQIRQSGHQDLCLVLTGKDSDYRHPHHRDHLLDMIASLGLDKHVRYLGVLPRDQQIQLMRRACAIVQPSFFEGWSMLVEDCRALGKTILLSDIPIHREQAYPSAHYFSPDNPMELSRLLTELWPALKPGPDLEAEIIARAENQFLIKENGQFLFELFKKVGEARG